MTICIFIVAIFIKIVVCGLRNLNQILVKLYYYTRIFSHCHIRADIELVQGL